ncbi:uncharacterized protein LOC119592055 isoform X2 [Penaeus monodon]|uniref:uncharacterized protein LOC119592055 isoform X2 n=1 Tax=Penaeus monodon TaxID=6687 RepID=UPI0018A6F769|nr:uncharacterized protein LOC119592055 isoform X2 [Penaeus monodon]
MDRLGEWALERYARTLSSPSATGKDWETLDSSAKQPLILILTKAGTMSVQAGRVLLEYWPLLHSQDIQPHVRADCMLFICKGKGDGRKWRIKFAGGVSQAEEQCVSCFRLISSFLEPSATPFPVAPPPSFPSAAPPPASSEISVSSSVPITTYSLVPVTHREDSTVLSGVTVATAPDAEPGPSASTTTAGTVQQYTGAVQTSGGGGVSWSYATPIPSDGDLNKSPTCLADVPDLEEMVRMVLQDPNLPDLVDVVHKVIANM